MEEENYFERIESYLKGTLTKEGKIAFEQELLSNPKLQEDTEMHKLAFSAIEYEISNDLKTKMGSWLNEEEESIVADPSTFKIRSLFRPLAIAVSLLLLVSLGLNFYAHKEFSNEKIVSAMAPPFENTPDRTRSAEDRILTKKDNSQGVNQKDTVQLIYTEDEIIKIFKQDSLQQLESIEDPIADYYAGILLINDKRYSEALEKFRAVIISDNPDYQLHAKLEYVKTALLNKSYKDDQEAKAMLIELKDGQNNYSKVAAELYKKLKIPLRRMFIS